MTLRNDFPGIPVQAIDQAYRKATFTANLSGGLFLFNQEVSIGKIPANKSIVISGVEFAANIDQLAFSDAIDPTFQGGFFSLRVLGGGNGHQLHQTPFWFTDFSQGKSFALEYQSKAANDHEEEIILALSGRLVQSPRILQGGKTTISINLSLKQYNIEGGYYA